MSAAPSTRRDAPTPAHTETYPPPWSASWTSCEPVGEDDYRFPDFGLFLSRYDRGESFIRVVEDLTLTDNQVYAAFYYLWSTVHLHEHQKNMAERVRAQRKSGFSVAAIAKREHISYAVVRAICRP